MTKSTQKRTRRIPLQSIVIGGTLLFVGTLSGFILKQHLLPRSSRLTVASTLKASLPSEEEIQPAIHRADNLIVKVEGTGCGGVLEGTGFAVGPHTLVTNAHVIAGTSVTRVYIKANELTAIPYFMDRNKDIALLHIDTTFKNPLSDIVTPRGPAGTKAVILGYPRGGGLAAQPAVIIGISTPNIDINSNNNDKYPLFEVRSKVAPGNSGGPLLDTQGHVLGLVEGKAVDSDGLGLVIEGSTVVSTLRSMDGDGFVPISTGTCMDELNSDYQVSTPTPSLQTKSEPTSGTVNF